MAYPYYGAAGVNASTSPAMIPYVNPNTQTITLVNGESEARAFPLNPGTTAFFMNANEKFFYIKTVDNFGLMSDFKRYKFYEDVETVEEVKAEPIEQPTADFVTREEFEELKRTIYNRKPNYKKKENKVDEQPAS